MSQETRFAFADELEAPCRFCASIFHIEQKSLLGQPVPRPLLPSATVTFLGFNRKVYAVTARHVIEDFRKSVPDPEAHTFFMPAAPGQALQDRFRFPHIGLLGRSPDIAVREIHPDLPAFLGKKAYTLGDESSHPPRIFPYAMAAGYPTNRKNELRSKEGWQLAMECVTAVAHGVSTGDGDQVQFFSEIEDWPDIDSLSGMSGGPVWWSDGQRHGLIGTVKEASAGKNSATSGIMGTIPHVHFVCQRITAGELSSWLHTI